MTDSEFMQAKLDFEKTHRGFNLHDIGNFIVLELQTKDQVLAYCDKWNGKLIVNKSAKPYKEETDAFVALFN